MHHCMLVQSSVHWKLNKCTNSTARGTATNQQSNTTTKNTTNTLKVKEEGLIHFGNVENLFSFLYLFHFFISCLRNLNIFTYFFLMLNFFFVIYFLLIHKIISIFIFFYIINLIISPKMRWERNFVLNGNTVGVRDGSRNCIKIEF